MFWGTYDIGKPRTRILLQGLRLNGVEVIECHANVWTGVADKSLVKGFLTKLRLLARWILSYPKLVIRYLQLPKHDVVIIGYMGQLDVLVLWPFARIRGVPIILDAYLSLYNTIVEDRGSGRQPAISGLVYSWEWLAYRAADLVIVDTKKHAQYFRGKYRLQELRVKDLWVGAEPEAFAPTESFLPRRQHPDQLTVLFYGAFIPLQGIETIVKAACLSETDNIKWIIIGRGQAEQEIRTLLKQHHPQNLQWISWVPYEEVVEWIQRADVSLGIFGDTAKAARVIPNKVFQLLLAGAPVVTRDSPAIREILAPEDRGVVLVPPANPSALLDGVRKLGSEVKREDWPLHRKIADRITPQAIGQTLMERISTLLMRRDGEAATRPPKVEGR